MPVQLGGTMGIVGVATNEARNLLERIPWYRRLGLDPTPVYRLLLIEAERNLALLNCLSFEDNNKLDDRAYLATAKLMEVSAIEGLFSLGDLKEKTLEALARLEWEDGASDSESTSATSSGSAADKMRRLYVSLCTVRSAAELRYHLEPGSSPLKRVNFRLRLKRIRANLYSLTGVLGKKVEGNA